MRGGIRKEIVGGMQKKKKEDYFQVVYNFRCRFKGNQTDLTSIQHSLSSHT